MPAVLPPLSVVPRAHLVECECDEQEPNGGVDVVLRRAPARAGRGWSDEVDGSAKRELGEVEDKQCDAPALGEGWSV